MTTQTRTQLESALKTARAAVNEQRFGTAEYDEAFERVRRITSALSDLPLDGEYTSIDGDIFDHQPTSRHRKITGRAALRVQPETTTRPDREF
jgi:hypothetical protein